MKITDVEAVALNMPLKQASKGGTYKIERRGTILTTISTSDGTTGQTYLGQTRTKTSEQLEACRFINSVLKSELLGEDPLMIERLWTKMHRHIEDYSPYDRTSRTIALESVACVDTSLYDLAGKTLGVPMYKLLGGSRDEVPLVQVQYYRQRDDFSEQLEGLRKAASDAKKAGFIGIKLKVGALPIEQDVERVRAVREEGGDGFVICTDANHAYSAEEAINFGKLIEPHSVSYLEQPVHLFDEKRDLRRIREAISIPISACQSFHTRVECMDFVTHGSVDLINPDILKVGGITEWVKIAHMADYYNVRMTAVANIETTITLFGGVPNTTWVTQQTPVREPFWSGGELVKNAPEPRGGYLRIPDVPGMGYEIREDAIEKYRVSQ